ncbi:hypothetical protein [Bradyrhizobium yuanmingense]|uniref:hypothetical protein n=1 Tax=Bradyrhizobium yuanmingense TaxID=108015 RepID=UPI0004B3382A|nr:hypothetical protein [Bradyrhizobium yuanmingense]
MNLNDHIRSTTPKTPRRVSGVKAAALVWLVFVLGFATGRASADTLFEATSQPGEAKAAFLHRVGAQMRAWSDDSRHEACAVIASDGERFGVVVTTSGSHVACANNHRTVPAGMTSTGETIHTHGANLRFKANKADAKLAGYREGWPVSGQKVADFSLTDYAEPGYLAAPGGVLLYQNGKGTQREVAL